MRDLADGFDVVESRVAARVKGSSLGSTWVSVRNAMGFGEPSIDELVLERLRLLAADGRFSEAASLLETSTVADLGADWAARVRVRATAVVATQFILEYALKGTAAAFTAAPAARAGDARP
jgi:hypothetical protein